MSQKCKMTSPRLLASWIQFLYFNSKLQHLSYKESSPYNNTFNMKGFAEL